jgi:PKD repeat protein
VFNATVQGASDMTWDFGDGTIVTGDLSPVHVYTAPGTYTVTFIASNATCMDVKTTFITVQDFTTGIDQASTEVFSIFPNPANAITDIHLRLPEREETLVINVLDAAGKLVKTFNFNSVEKQASLQINVEDLATGVYQLLLTGNSYSSSARLNVVR